MPSLLSWIISSFFKRFICHVTPCDVIARWQDSSLWDACFPSSMVLIMLLVVSCRSSEISFICFCENFLDSKNRLYLPSRKNEISPALFSTPKWNSASPMDIHSCVQMPLNWTPGLALMKS